MTGHTKEGLDAHVDQAIAHMAAQRASAVDRADVVQAVRGDQLAEQMALQFPGDRESLARVVTACSIEVTSMIRAARLSGFDEPSAANVAVNVLAFAGERLAHPEPEATP
jgi:hypothetical protein